MKKEFNLKNLNSPKLPGILCIVCGVLTGVFSLNAILTYLAELFSTVCIYAQMAYGVLSIENFFNFIFDSSAYMSTLTNSIIVNLPSHLVSLTVGCLSALSFIIFGLLLLKGKISKLLLFFPALQLVLLVVDACKLALAAISNIYNFFTILFRGYAITSPNVMVYVSGAVSAISGLLPILLSIIGFALLAVLILTSCGKKAPVLNILTPVCIASAPALRIVYAVIGCLYSLFALLTRTGGYGTMSRFLYYTFNMLFNFGLPQAMLGIVDALLSTVLSVAHHGIMAILLAVTFYLVAKAISAKQAPAEVK